MAELPIGTMLFAFGIGPSVAIGILGLQAIFPSKHDGPPKER